MLLQLPVLLSLLFAQDDFVPGFCVGEIIVICDFLLVFRGELVIGAACVRDAVIAIFVNVANIVNQVDDTLHIHIFHRHNVAHVVQTVCLTVEAVIRSQRIISLLRCHLVDNIIEVSLTQSRRPLCCLFFIRRETKKHQFRIVIPQRVNDLCGI